MNKKPVVCFITNSAGDWGGASRVLLHQSQAHRPRPSGPSAALPCAGPDRGRTEAAGFALPDMGQGLPSQGHPPPICVPSCGPGVFSAAKTLKSSTSTAPISGDRPNCWLPGAAASPSSRITTSSSQPSPGPFMRCAGRRSAYRATPPSSRPAGAGQAGDLQPDQPGALRCRSQSAQRTGLERRSGRGRLSGSNPRNQGRGRFHCMAQRHQCTERPIF
jgi:hypothetical protein